jgi:hypothetical protein
LRSRACRRRDRNTFNKAPTMANNFLKDDDDFFFQPEDLDLSDWQPMDIDQISEDPWLNMVTSPNATGLENLDGTGSLSDIFNISSGGISGMDPSQYASLFGGLANAARPAGATSGYAAGGGINIPTWLQALGVLGSLGTGLMSQHATNQATQQTVNGINAASDQAKQLIGAAQANYAPFTANVGQSLAKLASPVNLAGNFKPLGSGRFGG